MLGIVAIQQQRDLETARIYLEECVRLAREVDDQGILAFSLFTLSINLIYLGDPTRAAELVEESRTVFQRLSNPQRLWLVPTLLAYRDRSLKKILQIATLKQQDLVSMGEANNPGRIGWVLVALAGLSRDYGTLIQAEDYAREDFSRLYDVCSKTHLTMALTASGWIKQVQGDFEQAAVLHRECLAVGIEIGSILAISWSLYMLARVLAAKGQPEQAACFLGALEPLFDPDIDMESLERAEYEDTRAILYKQLGEERFGAALAEGRARTPEQILASLEQAQIAEPVPSASMLAPALMPSPIPFMDLTPREVEVLRLIAEGLTNPQIAAKLVLSSHTVTSHARSILSKLGVPSRTAAARFAIEHHLM
jgi:ATP/maltotriose-dependent transcriptional regulator MalT